MCAIVENKRLRKPKADVIVAYKVFVCSNGKPHNYCGNAEFKIGTNKWNKQKACDDSFDDQKGFQLFTKRKDAEDYATYNDCVAEVLVRTQDIAVIGTVDVVRGCCSIESARAYEVKQFTLTEEKWKNRWNNHY